MPRARAGRSATSQFPVARSERVDSSLRASCPLPARPLSPQSSSRGESLPLARNLGGSSLRPGPRPLGRRFVPRPGVGGGGELDGRHLRLSELRAAKASMAPTHTRAGAGVRPRPATPLQMGCEGQGRHRRGSAVPLPPLPRQGTKAGGGTSRLPDSVRRDGAGRGGRHRLLKAGWLAWCAPLPRPLLQSAGHPLRPWSALGIRASTGLPHAGPAAAPVPIRAWGCHGETGTRRSCAR